MKKRLLSILLMVCMVLSLLPNVALAATGTGTYGAFAVTYNGTAPSYASNTLTLGSGTYTISGTTTADKIEVVSGASANITLSGVDIDVRSTAYACAFDMSGATVNLTLSGINTLKSGSGAAGLRVPYGATLTITAASTGSLVATALSAVSPNPGAGIGGNEREACGTVTINGGTVIATGGGSNQGFAGAGIGGGGHSAGGVGGAGGTVTINGGIVTATGAENSAGIGGGGGAAGPTDGGGTGGTVTINGGTVIANGGTWRGAGIGGGGAIISGSGATVTINGGSVKATGGGNGAAAIGAGAAGSVAGTNHGTLKNSDGANVTLYTLTLPGINSTPVTALTTKPILGYTYGTTDMKTDTDGKLYVYLPSGKTTAGITTTDCIYSGDIASYTATLNDINFIISGTVNAGITGAAVSGLTVNLYESTDTDFANSVGSATTDGSGAYTIYAPNGSYVARVVGAAGSYAASVSGTITVSGGAVSGANITLARAAYSGDAASTPELISKTDIQVVLSTVTVTGQTVEYGKNTSNATPTAWQENTTFTGLAANTTYYFFARVKQAGAVEAGGVSIALTVTTKAMAAAAPDAPTIGMGEDKPTSNSITVSTQAGNEYYISTSAVADWSGTPNGYFKASVNGTHKFDSLSPATQYYIHVRVAEMENAMPSASASVMQYTLPTTPSAGAGYSVDFAAEKITVNSGYEVNTDAGFGAGTAIANNAFVNPNTTYYIRVAASGGVPASAARSFTIPARPAAPTAITADKTKNSITITPVAGQEYKIGSGVWQDSGSFTGLSSNTDYTVYARVKATGSDFASNAFSIPVTTKSTGVATTPTLSAVTYAPAKTLSNITLPLGWAWSAPATVPTVANSGYSAVYTPADAAAVDYSDITGYAMDGDGNVTITCTVPLTVNRATPTAADFSYTAPEESLNYNGTAKTASVNVNGGISGMGAVTVRYYQDGVETSPTNSGTYTVKIDLAQGENYAAASAITDSAWTFTIAKVAQAPLSITGTPANVTYGDTFALATTGGSGSGTVTWAVTSGSSATVDANTGFLTIIGVEETSITATKAADGNYSNAVTDTYTFTPSKRLITVDAPSATGGWTKTYDGSTAFDPSAITVGGITNKVGADDVTVSVQSAAYNTADVGSGNKTLIITYAIDGSHIEYYSAPSNTEITAASITAATPTISLTSKTATYTDQKVEIDAATVTGVTGSAAPDGAVTYTYYTKDTCMDADKTTVDKSGAELVGGAPKAAGTYYVKASIAANGNYGAATSAAVTLIIYYPSSGEDIFSTPVIVDGKTIDMGTSEVKDGITTVKVDQNKLSEQLKNAKDSVVIPITSKTDTASAQLVLQNVEHMTERRVTLRVKTNNVSYEIPAGSVDTAVILNNLGASDSSKVPLNVTISRLSENSITIKDGTLMVAPVAFSITAIYNGKNIEVNKFESYVQRVIEIPSSVDPKTITSAVVVEANGTQRHVPTKVYSEGEKWYAKVSSMTNSTYALIQSSASFADATGKWYAAVVAEMASRKVISGIGENMFAGERAITRAEFAAILVRALGLPADGTNIFSDVSASAWYSGAVATAAQYGLVTGKGYNRFAPEAYITRQEVMTMLQRAANLTDYTGTAGSLDGFTDAANVGTWAQGAAKWNVGSGLIVGSDGLLRPNDNISRAESATVIIRLLQKTGLIDVRSEA